MFTRTSLIAALTVAATTLTAPSAHAIVNGRDANPGDFPYMAQVQTDNGGACSGALISRNYVLTAAHCADGVSAAGMSVRVGNVDRNRGGVPRRVARLIRNPKYYGNINTRGTDVALLELSDPITNIAPLPLAPSTSTHLWDGVTAFANYDDGLAAGWGGIDTMGTLATRLQWVGNRILKPYTEAETGNRMIPVNTSICQGDSGSPLIVRVNGADTSAGVLTNGNCGVNGEYAEVAAGANRTFVTGNMAKMPYTFFGVGDWDRDGYQGYTSFGVADWDRDGNQDLLVRHDATGDVFLQAGTGVAKLYSVSTVTKIGTGFAQATAFGIADWDRDGHQDLVVRDDSNGYLNVWTGQSSRTAQLGSYYTFGSGWNAYTSFGVGDWDRDGRPDLIARQNGHGSSPLYLFPGQSTVALGAAIRIGQGFEGYSPFGLTDWDRDSHQDLMIRNDASQKLFLVPGISYRGPSNSTLIQIGSGY
jgi:V8-like Glu-specific endopeptidase